MKRWILGLGLCLSMAACDKDEDEGGVNDADRDFVGRASLSNHAEIAAGQVAANRGNTPMVRAFGYHMISEHSTAQTDLHNRASALGMTASDTLDAEHRALLDRLNSLSGYSFDTAYMNSQLNDHARTINFFETEIRDGRNASIRGYATDYLPHIRMHHERADSIRRAL